MGMNLRPFGRTGLMVSPLTLGTMEFGSKVDETEASRLLASAVDAGVMPSTRPTCTPQAAAGDPRAPDWREARWPHSGHEILRAH